MVTATQVAKYIKQIQGALSVLALLDISGSNYSSETNVRNEDEFDFVVIGGGSAGAVVAARLAEVNMTTLIIEPGGNPSLENELPGLFAYTKNSRMDWNYTSEIDGFTSKCRKKEGSLPGKVLGGVGATNYMIYARGNPETYNGFYKVTNDCSWKWENMLKYFKKTENLQDPTILKSKYGKYHSNKGTLGVTKENRSVCDDYLIGFKQAGEPVVVDNIGAGILGYSTALYNIKDGVRTESASTYLSPLKDNPHLKITRNSIPIKIIFDKNKNAIGVEFVKNNKTIMVKVKKEVILSMGFVKSPQLLMLSGIGPKKQLKKMNINVISDLPVGKNLQNGVGVLLNFRTKRPANPEPFNPHVFPSPLIVGYSALNKSSRNPDHETLNFIIDNASYFLSLCGFNLEFQNSICDRIHRLANNSQMLVTTLNNINPKSRGQIVLNSTDPFVQPRIIRGYYSNDDDLEATVDYIQDFMKILKAPHFKSMGLEFIKATDKCNNFEFGSRFYWRCYALCMFAAPQRSVGTCAMGSVVDTKSRVKGVNRLRVVDASIITNTIGSSIYAPVVAIAEKIVEDIIKSSK